MTREQALDLLPLLAGGDLEPEQTTAVREWLEWDPALAAEAATFDRLEAKLQAALAPGAPGAVAKAGAPATEAAPAPEAAPVVTVRRRCPYCHDAVDAAALVVCGSCATPHHGQCFEQNGGCSLLGCGGTSSIAAAGPASTVCGGCSKHTPADAPFCAWCGTTVAKDGAPAPLHARPAAAAAPYDWRRYAAAAALLLACSLGVGGAFGWQQALVVENGRVQLQATQLQVAELAAQRLVAELCLDQQAHISTFIRGRRLRPGRSDVLDVERYLTGVDELLATVEARRRRELEAHRWQAERWYRFEVTGGPGGYVVMARFVPRGPGARRTGRSFHATRPGEVRSTERWPTIVRDASGDPVVAEVDRTPALEADALARHRPAPAAVLERVELLEAQRDLQGALDYCAAQARAHPDDRVLRARVEELGARLDGQSAPSAWARQPLGARFVQRVFVEHEGRQRSHSLVEHEVGGLDLGEVQVVQRTTTRTVDSPAPRQTEATARFAATGPGPFDGESRERTTITVPAGTFPCWRARLEAVEAGGPTVTEVWFGDGEPLPYKLVKTAGAERTTMELVERPGSGQ